MTEQKEKTNRLLWIVAKSSHYGRTGIFIAGQTYQVAESTLESIDKEIDAYRKSLPKKQRSAVKCFQFEETVAPWDAYKDTDRLLLAEAQDNLNETQSELNQLRSSQQALINKKATLAHDLAEFEKASDKDLKKPGMLNRLHRKTRANLEIVEADIEQTVDDIKEHAAAAKSLEKQIADLRQVIAAKESKTEPASEDNSETTETDSASGSQNGSQQDTDNPEGQTTETN